MASTKVIASLLIEMGMNTRDAERSARRMEDAVEDVGTAAAKADKKLDKAAKSADKFGTAMKGVAKATDLLGSLMLGVGAAVAGVGAAVLKTGGDFETLRVQLKTATGSAEAAETAFAFIRDFTKNTPFQLGEVTDAFVKLKNFGIEPTNKNLTAFGDFASAMGKDLDQVIEAVLDATTGEFERLKEFGIRASQQGDKVALTFKGITTTVGKNSKEISGFLTGIAEENFGGAMADQMLTLGGGISNLMDQFSEFFNAIAQDGPLQEFKLLLKDISGIAGDREGGLAKTIARTLTKAIKGLRRLMAGDFVKTLETAAKAVEFLVGNFDKLIALFVAGKTASAFSAMASGFTQMGLAAGASLGPIGLVAAALIALIPIALDVGNAIGDALATGSAVGRPGRRAPLTESQKDLLSSSTRADLRRANANTAELKRLAGGEGSELSTEAMRQEAQNVAVRKRARKEFDAIKAKEKRDGMTAKQKAEADAKRVDRETRGAQFAAAFGGAPLSPEDVRAQGGSIEDQSAAALLEEEFAAGMEALDKGSSVEDALSAGGDRAVGLLMSSKKGGKKKKGKKKPVSIKTVSDFFGAASRGEIGQLADQTPAIAEIEPTVAVDVTNNNYNIDAKITVKGTADAKETAGMVGEQIRIQIQRGNDIAGEQLAGNTVR